jgi:serine/threonine protein kinase/tetratricopeptide (TPR) repeat protein
MPEPGNSVPELFDAALREVPARRNEFLRRACAGDQALLAEVQSLLDEYERSGHTGNTPPPEGISAADLADLLPALEGPGTVIGPYTLLAQLGSGGMGVVYEAEQLHPIRRRVALKVLKPGMDSREIVTRFEGERQALALMSHPNIAQVFDAGTTATGRPYFAMELVDGIPITRYCEAHGLGVRERLELFIPVCQAIQHAHQKGIIHRDIKPSNVLVTAQDGQAAPKVIDFGIAKATGARLTDATMATHLGTVIGTLDYMSPEQADLSTQDIDTRSDIYSLGAVLYELLTGSTPLDSGRSASTSYIESLRQIREEDPPPPSARLSRTGTARLTKTVHGELDWIVMKALEKDRTRRYETANALVRDLQRYLSGEPVEAGPPSATYRLRKVARKYRGWLAAGAAFTILLIAATAVSAWMAVRASRARQEAQAVIAFLQNDLLKQASPFKQSSADRKPDPDLKVRTLLNRAAARVTGQFDQQPQVEASIRETIGDAYNDLGVYAEAAKQLERALDLRRRVLGPEHPDTLSAMNNLGSAYHKLAKFKQAETLLTQAMQIGKRVLGPENSLTLEIMDHLAGVYQDEDKTELAEKLMVQIVETQKRVLGPEHPETLSAMGNLSQIYLDKGQFAQAENVLSQVVESERRALGPEHPERLTNMFLLAVAYRRQGKSAQAETLFTQVSEIQSRVLGPEHPNTLKTQNNLAIVYSDEGKYAQAAALYEQLLGVRRRVTGPAHPDTLSTMNNLGKVYYSEGKFAQAEAQYTQLLELGKNVLSAGLTATARGNLAGVLVSEGKYGQAEALLQQTAESDKRVLGTENPDTLTRLALLADTYRNEKKDAQAEALLNEVVESQKRVLGPKHFNTLRTLGRLAQLYRDERKYQQAETLFAQVLETQRRVLRPGHPDTLNTMADLAQTYLDQSKYAQAEPMLREGLGIYEAQLPDSWERYRCQSLLGASLAGQKKYAEAEPLLVAGYRGMVQRKVTIPAPELYNLDYARQAIARLPRSLGKPG